jgi:membrane protein DedA with SNARE-associated domain
MIGAMHASALLAHYGLLAVFIGGLFEGETILMLGAYAVHQGYLSLWPLIACGAAAAFLADQFYFQLGRRRGAALLEKRPTMARHIARVNGFVSRHPVATVFLMRFAWGLRIVLPATLGMGPMRTTVFAALSVPASIAWAAAIAVFGLKLTELLHELVGHLRPYEHRLILAALVITLVAALARQWYARR